MALCAAALATLSTRAFAEEAASATRLDLEAGLAEGSYPLTADRAAALALESAPSLARARAAVEAAEQGETEALVPMVPRLELQARYLRLGGFDDGQISLFSSDVSPEMAEAAAASVSDPAARMILTQMVGAMSGGISFHVPRDQYTFRASLTFPLSDLLVTLLPAYRAAQAQTELEERRAAAERVEVELAAREAYYRYAGARGGLEVARAAVALADEHLGNVEAMVAADLAATSDLAQARAYGAASRAAVARAEAGVAVSEAALLSLLHVQPDGEIALSEPLTAEADAPPEIDQALLDEAYAARPEVRALEQALVVQDRARQAASGGYWPHLAIVAGADYDSPNQRVIPPSDEFTPSWEVGAVLSWSPSDTALADARVRRARAMREAAEADLDRLRDGVRLSVVRAREEWIAARTVMAMARERVAAAEEGSASRAAELRAGEGVPSDVLDADIEVTRARLEVLQAGVDLRLAETRFRHATGRLGGE